MTDRLSRSAKVGYGVAAFGDSALYGVFVSFFLFFLTDVASINAVIAGALITLGSLCDAITDPLVGTISDRTRSKFGRRRPYMLFVAIPLGVSSWLIFTDPGLDPTWSSVYYFVVLIVYFTAYTLFYVPWTAFGAELTTDYDERSSVMSYKMAWSTLGALPGGAVPLLLVGYFRPLLGTERAAWSAMAASIGVVATASILVTWRLTRGLEPPPGQIGPGRSWGEHFMEAVRIFSTNTSFRYVVGLFSFGVMATSLSTSFVVYYCQYYLGLTETQISLVWLVLIGVSLPWIPFLNFTARRAGKRFAYALLLGFWVVGNLLVLFFVGRDDPLLFCLLGTLWGGGWVAVWALGWAMIGDVVEVDEFRTGERREGLYFGLIQFLQKFAAGLILLVGGGVLSAVGYIPNVEQTDGALLGIRLTLCLGVALLLCISIAFALLNPMTKERHDALRLAIAAKKAGREVSSIGFEEIV